MSAKCYVKVHRVQGEVVISICDENLLGKKFKHGAITIDFSSKFFGGELMDIDEALSLLEGATIASLFGENVIKKAVEKGLFPPGVAVRVAGIPHVQLVR
ncbi:MAG: DUF424 domain-containing protein [Thermoprotei archaeon]|nr:MAG: DUF424 domain-containing protein [Thermoprotei archaeon]RLE98473.1 MAG: DUF424 domain-containing protein [Thermoprotei archaeon]